MTLVTTSEFAQLTGMSPSTVNELAARGELGDGAVYRFGARVVRIDADVALEEAKRRAAAARRPVEHQWSSKRRAARGLQAAG